MGRYQGGTDSADPLGIMRLTRGVRGTRTEPQVGTGPTFIILTVFPIGFMVLMSGLRWPFYQSLAEVPNWKWKIEEVNCLTSIATFLLLYSEGGGEIPTRGSIAM